MILLVYLFNDARNRREEQAVTEQLAKEKADAERIAAERALATRQAEAKAAAERITKQNAEAERIALKKEETKRLAMQKMEAEKIAKKKADAERVAAEKAKLAENEFTAKGNSVGMKFKLCPAGTFTMGSANGDRHERPHLINLTKPFWIGVHEVTQDHYEKIMGKNPSKYKGPDNPVEEVSWDDAVEFCRKLSELPEEKIAGRIYRLPTEAEWEYACRAGSTTNYYFGDNEFQLDDYSWYNKNSKKICHPVGLKKPNAWGLYDMHGNAWEWCSDWFGPYNTQFYNNTDPTGPSSGSSRVIRGGSWFHESANCQSATRFARSQSIANGSGGFRMALSPWRIDR